MSVASRAQAFINGSAARWVQWGMAVLVIPTFLVGVKIMVDVEVIKANRFTATDGQRVWQELALKANKSEVPPKMVRDALDRIDAKLDELNTRLSRIEGRLKE